MNVVLLLKMSSHDKSVNEGNCENLKSSSCQGSMGLHQNNCKRRNYLFDPTNSLHENTIAEVFRKFRDRCILRFRDGVAQNPVFGNKIKGDYLFIKLIFAFCIHACI